MTVHDVVSPLPGTYYAQESPTSAPFVTPGAAVRAGDTIGLVEVMKMFTPVTCAVTGTVAEICVENEDAVEPGTVLLRIEEG